MNDFSNYDISNQKNRKIQIGHRNFFWKFQKTNTISDVMRTIFTASFRSIGIFVQKCWQKKRFFSEKPANLPIFKTAINFTLPVLCCLKSWLTVSFEIILLRWIVFQWYHQLEILPRNSDLLSSANTRHQ